MSDERINDAIDFLRENGYVITRPEWEPWTTPVELLSQYSILSMGGIHKRLRAFRGEFPQERGPTGRLKRLRPTAELRAWLARPLEQGTRNDLSTTNATTHGAPAQQKALSSQRQ